jgi:CHAT domain-containing protein
MSWLPSLLVLTLLAPLDAAADEPVLLAPGTSVTRAVAEGDEHAYRLDVRQGHFVRAVIEQAGVDVAATVRGPDGGLVLETSSPNTPFGPNPLVFVATAGGLQEITLRAEIWRTPSSYTLRVEAVREPTDDDRARAEAVAVNGRWTALLRNDATRRETVPVLLDARARWQALGDEWMEMWTGLSLGAVLSGVLGKPQQAADALERPLQIALATHDEYAEARVRFSLGESMRRLGLTVEAREHFERAAALHRAAGMPNDLSRVLVAQATLLGAAGFDQESLDLRYEAFRIAESLPETLDKPERQERATLALANAYLRVNEPALALETLDRPFPALAASDRNGHSSVWMARGAAYRELGDDTRAYEALLEAYEDREALGNRPLLAEVLMRLSDLHLRAGEWDTSLTLLEEADAILEAAGQRPTQASAQCQLGYTRLAAGAPAPAATAFTRALALAGEANASARHCATTGLGRVALAAGNLEQALGHAEAAVALVESRRDGLVSADDRAGVLSHDAEAYELLGHVRMRLHASAPDAGHAAAALAVAEASRARSLLDVIAEGRRDGAADDPRARPLDAGAIARALDADTILLEYALGDDASYLWVVSRDALRAYALPPRSAIQAAARPVRERLASAPGTGGDAGAAADARRLSDLLLGPAAELLGGKRLLVVAADVLQYVPFAALPDPRRPDGTPLLARHVVVQAPSASAAVAIRSRPAAAARGPVVAVLADPVYERRDPRIAAAARVRAAAENGPPRLALRGTSLARLPFSRAEADAITRAARPGRAHRALGFDATREAVLGSALQEAQIVHFAAHGVVDSARAARAGIVLSLFDRQGRPQEGFLGLRDVYDLRLSADLVVLSACETALGRDLRGEGLVGLTTGFLYAGARQVVASLWRVDDLATSELMARFYRSLLQQRLPPAAALRAAQLEMAADRRWRDPYFWAGFVVFGDWR